MTPFIILGAFFLTPIVMLGVIGAAIVAKVGAGIYTKPSFSSDDFSYQSEPKAPRPSIAVLLVVMPVAWAGIYGTMRNELDWITGSIFTFVAIVLAAFVYVAARKRYREFGDK